MHPAWVAVASFVLAVGSAWIPAGEGQPSLASVVVLAASVPLAGWLLRERWFPWCILAAAGLSVGWLIGVLLLDAAGRLPELESLLVSISFAIVPVAVPVFAALLFLARVPRAFWPIYLTACAAAVVTAVLL